MTDDEAALAAAIPGFAGYATEADRRATDEHVRGFVGERLAEARERAGASLDAAARDRLDAVIFRCEFADQRYTHRLAHESLDDGERAALARCDLTLVESVRGEIGAGNLAAIVARVDDAFDARLALASGSEEPTR